MKYIKLSEWAKLHGYSRAGAYKAYRAGRIPGATQLKPRTAVLVPVDAAVVDSTPAPSATPAVIYCRVGKYSPPSELAEQQDLLTAFCQSQGWQVVKTYAEIANGFCENRVELHHMLDHLAQHPNTTLVVETQRRLTHFGYDYLERLIASYGCQLVVVDDD